MEPDLQITIKGLPEELSTTLGNTIGDIIKGLKEVDENLDFRRMHRIIVTSDFAGELALLSPETSSGNQITHTNEDYAVAVAKVMLLPFGDEFEIVPILNAEQAVALVGENEEYYQSENFLYILHLLHHELCHVHDNNKKIDAFHKLMLKHHYNGKDIYIRPLAEICWSEYIANFLSSNSATPQNLQDIITCLVDAITRTKRDIDNEILSYRHHHDLEKLFSLFKRHGEFLIKTAAYTLGYIDGLDTNLESISQEASKILKGSYFESTWHTMHEALTEMRSEYADNWTDLNIYNKLSEVLENYYDEMGLILSTTADGEAYLDIPFRPETTPDLL